MNAIINGEKVVISKLKYKSNGRIALSADCENEPYAILTVNLPDEEMEKDETAIDVNNLGMGIIEQLVKQSIIKGPRGDKWVQSGFVTYPICKVIL